MFTREEYQAVLDIATAYRARILESSRQGFEIHARDEEEATALANEIGLVPAHASWDYDDDGALRVYVYAEDFDPTS